MKFAMDLVEYYSDRASIATANDIAETPKEVLEQIAILSGDKRMRDKIEKC